MPKKMVCLIALLLANALLLGHAVVPHHHHEASGVCFHLDHCSCTREMECQCENAHEEASRHQKDTTSEKCCTFVDDAYTPSENNDKEGCAIHTKCGCGGAVHFFISNAFHIQRFVDKPLSHFRHKPCMALPHTGNIPLSFGLRAPPVC